MFKFKRTEDECEFYFNVGSFNFVTWHRKYTASSCVRILSSWFIHLLIHVEKQKAFAPL